LRSVHLYCKVPTAATSILKPRLSRTSEAVFETD